MNNIYVKHVRCVISNVNICKKNVYAYNMRNTDPCACAAQSIDYADPSVAQSKHRVGGEIPSLGKVNVNKVSIFNGILYVVPVAVHFQYNAFMWTVTK